jgi:uncharacterized protein involved in response to NO
MALMKIEERSGPAAPTAYAGLPLLALGFRPFYLAAAAFAALSIPLWLAVYYGLISAAGIGLLWHMHEMVFGFVLAVVIGFLYTAGRNWTGLWTPRGPALAALVALWLAGRLAMLAPVSVWSAALEWLFLPLATWPLYRVLARSGNRRNMVLVVVLALLSCANLCFHAAQLGWLDIAAVRPIYAALIMIVVIEAIIGGRIIPNFTANAVPGTKPVQHAALDRASMLLTVLAGLAWAVEVAAAPAAALAFGAALLQATRLLLWQPLVSRRLPLLWILHLSYAWIPAGFAALALAHLGVLPVSSAVHLLGVGGMGGLIIGMMTRTALGHTGRLLKAGPAETSMYVAIQAGVLARLCAGLTGGAWRDALLILAGIGWSAAFLLYILAYASRLAQPRIDGREG